MTDKPSPVAGELYRASYLMDSFFEILGVEGNVVRTTRYDITEFGITSKRIDYLDDGFVNLFEKIEGDEKADFEMKLLEYCV